MTPYLRTSLFTRGVLTLLVLAVYYFLQRVLGEAAPTGFLWQEIFRFRKVDGSAPGLFPFFAACLLLQLMSIAVPPVRRSLFGGEEGRKRLFIYALLLAIPMAVLFYKTPMAIFASVLACGVLVIFSELICRFGIGNGYALLSLLPIVPQFSLHFDRLALSPYFPTNALLVIITLGVVGAYAFRLVRKPTVLHASHESSGAKATLNFRPTWFGQEPYLWALVVAMFPLLLPADTEIPIIGTIATLLARNGIGNMFLILLTGLFCFAYQRIVFSAAGLGRLMQSNGFRIDEAESAAVHVMLRRKANTASLKAVLFFSLLILARYYLAVSFDVPFKTAEAVTGALVLMFVGVVCDVFRQVAFFRSARAFSKPLAVCYTALDENEAEIQRALLQAKGFDAFVEPLTFSWGLPVRTPVDRYRIYVEAARCEEARALKAITSTVSGP